VLWALLNQPPATGFEICATVSSATGRRCSPRRLLPSLIRLEGAGLLTVDRSTDPYRYALTPLGTTAAYDAGPGLPEPTLLVMADLVGFTRFTEQHGDGAAHEQASRLTALAKAAVRPLGGSVVKSLGDGVLLGLPPVTQPVPLVRDLAARLMDGPRPWRLHAAAHLGSPLRHAGDLFGRDVNLVARLCARAGSGELLLTATDGDATVQLDGVEQPVRVRRIAL
jgi:class 3 adenylate cyclase